MDAYRSVLESIARRNLLLAVFVIVVLLAIVGTIWFVEIRYFKKMKKEQPKKYNSENQVKVRRKTFFAAITLTAICAVMIAFFVVNSANQNRNISRDIQECSYITYVGDYSIYRNGLPGKRVFNHWCTVRFDVAGSAKLYVKGLLPDIGNFAGTVVYGKHSLLVVYVAGEEV